MTEKNQQLSEQDKELISSIYEDFNKYTGKLLIFNMNLILIYFIFKESPLRHASDR